MSSSSGNSSGSDEIRGRATYLPSEDRLIVEKKRKRMESNRESARRSRMRKQRYINELTAEASRIKTDNDRIRTTIELTTNRFVEIEAENSVLRAQVSELSQSLESLNGILNMINTDGNCTTAQCVNGTSGQCINGRSWLFEGDLMENSWNVMCVNQQPIMASAGNMFGYY